MITGVMYRTTNLTDGTNLMAGRDFNRLLTELYPEEENLFDQVITVQILMSAAIAVALAPG
jgi:hypothetical protein